MWLIRYLFWDLPKEMWREKSLASKVGLSLILLSYALLFALASAGMISFADCAFVEERITTTRAAEAGVGTAPAHWAGRVYVPEKSIQELRFTVDDQLVTHSVSKETLESTRPGQRMYVLYYYGRLSGKLYVRTVQPIKNEE